MVFSSIAQSYFDEFPFRRKEQRRKRTSGYFFLSHAHSDHTSGLQGILSDPDATLVCSNETAAVVKTLFRIPREKCLIVKPDQSLNFDDFIIHVLDANHCVGSLMYVIESENGLKEVYTGDFRLGESVLNELELLQDADHLWLDYTYGKDSIFKFPSREALISDIITLILSGGNFPERNVWISAYQIGKEKLLQTISNALKVKIWAPSSKIKIYKEIGGEFDIFTNDTDSGVFVGSRRMVENLKGIEIENHKRISDSLRISPTGWAMRSQKRLDVHFFAYSDHCSFDEVHRFIKMVNARNITKI